MKKIVIGDRPGGRRRLRRIHLFQEGERRFPISDPRRWKRDEIVDAINGPREDQRGHHRFGGEPGLRDDPADLRRFQFPRAEGPGDRSDRTRGCSRRRSSRRGGSVDNAKAALERAQVGVIDTERTNRRNRELVKDGFIPRPTSTPRRQRGNRALAQKRSAEAALQQGRGRIARSADESRKYTTIRSPVDGIRHLPQRPTWGKRWPPPSRRPPCSRSRRHHDEDAGRHERRPNPDIGPCRSGAPGKSSCSPWTMPEKTFAGTVAQGLPGGSPLDPYQKRGVTRSQGPWASFLWCRTEDP